MYVSIRPMSGPKEWAQRAGHKLRYNFSGGLGQKLVMRTDWLVKISKGISRICPLLNWATNAECVEYAAHGTSRFRCCKMHVDNHYMRRANFWTATVVKMSFIDAPLVCMPLDYTWLFCSFSGWRSRPSAPWCFEVFPWIGNHAPLL